MGRRTLIIVLLAVVGGIAAVQADTPIVPWHEDPTEAELAFYDEQIPCPEIEGLELSDRSVSATSSVTITCSYRTEDGLGQRITVEWLKPGTIAYTSASCAFDRERLDDGTGITDYVRPFPDLAVTGTLRIDRAPELEPALRGALEILADAVRPFARSCAEPPSPIECPDVAGFTYEEQDPETDEPREFQPETYLVFCRYFVETDIGGTDQRFQATAWFAPPGGAPGLYDRLCNELPWEAVGFGVVVSEDRAVDVFYQVYNPERGPDLAVARGLATEVLGLVEPMAASCDAAEPQPSTFDPFPDYLAAAFVSELTDVPGGKPEPVTATDGGAATTTTTSGTPATTSGSAVTTVPVSGDEAEGLLPTVLRVGSIVMLVLSVVGLLLAFLLARRETRIRPGRDLLRIAISVAVAVGGVLVLGREAPLWAVLVAVGLGLVVGTIQGATLLVRRTDRGLMARRGALAVVVFGIGVVLMQGAGLLARSGVVVVGVAISFLSAAITAGLIVGRRPRVADAAAGTGVLLLVGMATALVGVGAVATAQETDDGLCEREGLVIQLDTCEGYQHLLDVVPWDEARFHGGLWAREGKPTLALPVPRGLASPPEPAAQEASWTVTDDDGTVTEYEIDELVEFAATAYTDGGETVEIPCCSVTYTATGTKTVTPPEGEPTTETYDVSGRLEDVHPLGSEAGDLTDIGIPFTEITTFRGMPEESCQRALAWRLTSDTIDDRTWNRLVVDGEDSTTFVNQSAAIFIECDALTDFTYERALEVAPPRPDVDDPVRLGNARVGYEPEVCPVRQDIARYLAPVTGFDGVATGTLADLFLEPNAEQCDYGGLFDPPSFGQGGRGETRHELIYRLAYLNDPGREAARLAEDFDSFYREGRTTSIAPHERCELGPDGVPLPPPDGSDCSYVTIHTTEAGADIQGFQATDTRLLQMAGGQVVIRTEYVPDGPNVSIRAHLPWGKYVYRCHHCEPGDPAITTFLSGLHRFGAERGLGDPDAAPASPLEPPPGAVAADDGAVEGEDGTTTTTEPGFTEETEFTPVAEEGGVTAEEAALIGLVGLLGSMGLLGTALAGTGLSPADIAEAIRRGDVDDVTETPAGAAPPSDEPPVDPSLLDEFGDPMYVNDGWDPTVPDGHVWWDDGTDPRWIPRDEAIERVGAEREAIDAAEARRAGILADHETGWRERFDAMRERAARRAEAERLAEAQALGDPPRVRSRDEILAGLEAAEREQEAANEGWWGTFLDAFWDGTYRDTMSLPDVARQAGIATRDALDATYDAVTDPENWRIAGETVAQTAVDVAGTFVGRTDAADQAADSFSRAANTARAVGSAVAKDPWGFAKSVTPIGAFEKGVDPDVPLGERIGNMWMGSLDVMLTIGTGGAAKVVDAGADTLRAADALTDAARTAERLEDTLDTARAAERLGDAADAGRTIDRLDDTGDAARAGARLDDSTDVARTAGGRRIPSDAEVAARREAWQELQARGRRNVDDFERVLAEGGDARAAALRVQADKRALQQINERSEDVRAAMNAEMRRIYKEADDAMLREVAERNGFRSGTLREVTDAGTPAGHRVFVDDVGNEVHLLEPTNPSSVPKVGADRDLTVRIRPADPDWTRVHGVDAVDVDHRVVQQVYDDAFYDAAGGDEVFDALGLADEPGRMRSTVFSERMDQVATDALHPEAYTDVQRVIHGPGADLTDAQQVGMTVGYKGEHWFGRAEAVEDAVLREDFMAEGMRQLTKQTDNQALRRLDAINSQRAVAGLSEARMPARLEEAVDIMRRVNPKPGSGVAPISPAEAERLLAVRLDTDPATVARDLGGFVEALDTLGSRNDAFDALRRVGA
ncbi:MAG: hypothetical protein R3290_10765, partial [Acidimicrobiia bacterium]|nr:hypothetical protein [Acidimicrobiia bacterium]